MTTTRSTAALLALLAATAVAGCGADGGGDGTGAGPAMRMTVAVCVGEDAGVDPFGYVSVVQDDRTVGSMGALYDLPTWMTATTGSGTVQLVADGEVLDEATGGPGERVDLAAGTCTTPDPVPTS
ncbi:hypothetical protein [uncultured Pseudokineococcus sp.]|uniref:hypothetical protein n=1 Tax=uncultured Pseudokineococcus sp. TaxID=1642928 RepID=UPI0026346AFE|nr:hypothetical protein [uncultured Pseudokineococcus sp.]